MNAERALPMQRNLQRIFDAAPGCFLVLAPDSPRFTILAATDAYLSATKTRRGEILGKGVFEVFPDNPDDPATQAVDFARASFQRVVENRRPDVMGIREHDIRRPESEGGGFEERIWNAANFPVLGADGQVACIIHHVEDVTESVRQKQRDAQQQAANLALRDSRRAALNLMEDAVEARRRAEELNTQLRAEITERKRAEEALREANERLELRVRERTAELTEAFHALRRTGAYTRSLIEASLDPLVTIGPDGTITDVNAATESATGRTRQELVGTDFSTCFTEPDKARTGYRQVFQEGSIRDYPLDIRHRDGRTIPVLYNAALYRDEAGQVVGIFAAARDVTERKQAEARAQAERQRLYDVLETLPVYVVLLTTDHHVPFANRFFRERFGESNGRRCYEYLFQRREPCEICETYTVLKTREPHHWYWTGPDGRNYDIYDFPFTDSDGSRLILEMGIDITERKRAEAALQDANDRLEQHVAERTAELARSNKELEQFAYIASHDLQEPLRMVSGFLRLLEDRYKPQLDDKAQEYIGYSVEGATRMSQLITDLLAYSRVERKGRKLDPIDAAKALAIAMANLRASIAEAGALVTHDELPTVLGDATQLAQLLQNLIGNALKFRAAARPCRVHVGTQADDNRWVFSVRDNGIGIPPESHDRIFVIFQRLHTRAKYAGTGIGLAICKKIVERHGGRIWVESTPGEGSTFRFTLPKGRPA